MNKIKELISPQLLIRFGLPLVFIVLYVFVLFFPAIGRTCVLLKEVSQLHSEIATVEKEWEQLDVIKSSIAQANKKITFYETRLPGEKEIPAILEYLSNSARKLDVKITEIKPVERSKDKADSSILYYSVPILLKAECGYHQLGRFINELERADRFMKISDMQVTSHPTQKNILYVQLMIVTYVMG